MAPQAETSFEEVFDLFSPPPPPAAPEPMAAHAAVFSRFSPARRAWSAATVTRRRARRPRAWRSIAVAASFSRRRSPRTAAPRHTAWIAVAAWSSSIGGLAAAPPPNKPPNQPSPPADGGDGGGDDGGSVVAAPWPDAADTCSRSRICCTSAASRGGSGF